MEKKTKSFQKFVGNVKEGQGFADKRKKKATYEYLKLLKKEKRKSLVEGKTLAKHRPIHLTPSPGGTLKTGKRQHAFTAAQKIAKKKQDERQKRKEEESRVKVEKATALKVYEDRKRERHLKLCKRTSKGQPVMKHQMDVLLQKIQKQKGNGR